MFIPQLKFYFFSFKAFAVYTSKDGSDGWTK